MTSGEQAINTHGNLWLKVIIGLFLGVVVGVALGPDFALLDSSVAETIGGWLALPGNLFLTLIRFIIIPLVISSIILGIAGGDDAESIKKIGVSVLIFIVAITGISAFIGVAVTQMINPGGYIDQALVAERLGQGSMDVVNRLGVGDGTFPERIVGIFPTNPIQAMAEGALLQIVIASIIFGVALLVIPKDEAAPLKHLLNSVQSTCMMFVNWLMKFAPVAVFGLLANVMIIVGFTAFVGVAAYVATFLLVLLIILAMFLAILKFYCKRSPIEFLRGAREPMVIGFSTSSSSATMPITLRATEENLGVNPLVSRLVIPVGATINMSGTSAYQAVVVIFLAQVFGVQMGPESIMILLALAIGSSIGSPGVPGGSLGILITILITVGIPPEGIALVLSVDRIMDMCRTSVNLTGDMVMAVVMEKFTKSELPKNQDVPSTEV